MAPSSAWAPLPALARLPIHQHTARCEVRWARTGGLTSATSQQALPAVAATELLSCRKIASHGCRMVDRTTKAMAAEANKLESMGDKLHTAAMRGDAVGATQLLDAGTPVGWRDEVSGFFDRRPLAQAQSGGIRQAEHERGQLSGSVLGVLRWRRMAGRR